MAASTDEQYIPRNYRLGVVNGALFTGGTAFLNSQTVLAVFIVALGGTPFLVGVVSSAVMAGFMLPTLLLAHGIETAERKKRFYVISAALRVACLVALIVSVLVLARSRPLLLCGLAVVLLFGRSLAIAIGVLAFYQIVSHSVPARRRGAFFAWRLILGSLLATAGACLVYYLLDEQRSGLALPYNYAAVFTMALVLCGGGTVAFCFVKEPPMPVDRRGTGFLAKIREGWRCSREHQTYRRFILCRLATAMTMVASPFLVVYSLHVLAAPWSAVAVFVAVQQLTFLVSTPLWARISDGVGNSRLLRVVYPMGVVAPLLALLLPALPSWAVGPPAWGITLRWVGAVGMYVVACAAFCGARLGGTNYLLEVAPPERRPIYMAMVYTYVVPVVVGAPLLGGWLARSLAWGYALNFVIAAVFAAIASVGAFTLEEPREQAARQPVAAESIGGIR